MIRVLRKYFSADMAAFNGKRDRSHNPHSGIYVGRSKNIKELDDGPNEFELYFDIKASPDGSIDGSGWIKPLNAEDSTRIDLVINGFHRHTSVALLYRSREQTLGFYGCCFFVTITEDWPSANEFPGIAYGKRDNRDSVIESKIHIKKESNYPACFSSFFN